MKVISGMFAVLFTGFSDILILYGAFFAGVKAKLNAAVYCPAELPAFIASVSFKLFHVRLDYTALGRKNK